MFETKPRRIASSAISRWLQWLIGRSLSDGFSQVIAITAQICSGVYVAGAPERGASASRSGTDWVGGACRHRPRQYRTVFGHTASSRALSRTPTSSAACNIMRIRMPSLLGEARVIDDPSLDRSVTLYLRQHQSADLGQNPLVRPVAFPNKMQQRLMLCRRPFRRSNCRHRLDALTFARHHQPHAIIAKRFGPICVPDYARQTLDVRRKPRCSVTRFWQTHLSPLHAEN